MLTSSLLTVYIHTPCCAVLRGSVVSDSLRPHGLQPARLLCPWDSPGKSCHALLRGFSQPRSPALQADSLPTIHYTLYTLYIHLRYADDTTFMAESEEELKSLLMKAKERMKKLA